ncbi:MAG TPA: helix-turn-helix domain-containing protein [Jatrophihabitantaceae bacterium]|nr:helix-turn-helix domain-containing protein [Jatrophihabitantaceae bacterium]
MADIQQQVEALAGVLGCAVLVEDQRHRPLWWSAQGEVDDVRLRSILQREPPPGAAALVTRLGLPNAQGPVRTPALPDVDMAERWCVPLRHGRNLLGYLWVLDADGRVSEDDLEPVVACARAAADAIARTAPSDEARLERRTLLITRLLAGRDDDAAGELVDLEKLRSDARVAVASPARSGGWTLPGGLSAHVDPAPGAVFAGGAPVAIADLGLAVERARTTARALRAGARLTAPTWDALGEWHLIAVAPPELTPGLLHPGADVLAAQKRPELIETARCVLDNGGDVTVSAEQLHIHRTTLYYRLERIEALTGVNLRLATLRDALQMALHLAAYRAAGD